MSGCFLFFCFVHFHSSTGTLTLAQTFLFFFLHKLLPGFDDWRGSESDYSVRTLHVNKDVPKYVLSVFVFLIIIGGGGKGVVNAHPFFVFHVFQICRCYVHRRARPQHDGYIMHVVFCFPTRCVWVRRTPERNTMFILLPPYWINANMGGYGDCTLLFQILK